MKYIIDIPNCVLWIQYVMQTPSGTQNLKSESVLQLEEYTEPDRKAIDLQHAHDIENVARMNYSKGAEDAWEFVNTLYGLSDEELYEIFDDGNYCEHSYQEAKSKYEEWKRTKEEIRVGDEVVYADDPNKEKATVLRLYQPKQYKPLADILCEDGTVVKMVVVENLAWTGRHFDEVAELLKKMKKLDD